MQKVKNTPTAAETEMDAAAKEAQGRGWHRECRVLAGFAAPAPTYKQALETVHLWFEEDLKTEVLVETLKANLKRSQLSTPGPKELEEMAEWAQKHGGNGSLEGVFGRLRYLLEDARAEDPVILLAQNHRENLKHFTGRDYT